MDTCKTLHFADHPCGQSVLGTVETIEALTAEQMREYFYRRYAPNNMVLACCGNVDFEAVCELAEKKCSDWKTGDTPRQLSFFGGSRDKQRQVKANLVREHICIMSPAVSMQDERRFAMSLLATIVGDDTGSRYFWAMVDPAIAETAAMQFDSMDGVGVLYSYIRCSPENAAKVLDIIKGIFDDLAEKGIAEDELGKAKNKVLSALTIKNETPMGRLVDLGFNWVYLKQYRLIDEDIAAVNAVTVDAVNAIIKEFRPGDFTKFAVGPAK
ncbi:MAG: insulinase family protein, partial [Planctomycetes bacterium]|nr:insulinase family protein [Planctomycetota bacterium]